MSNEPTPDTPDADDGATTPAEPTDSDTSAVPPVSDEADPTVDVWSDVDPAVESESDPGSNPNAGFDEAVGPAEPTDPGPDADASTDPFGAPAEGEGGTPPGGYVPPQPPPPAMVPPVRRLVRDPYSRLGGVCSGIAHHTGVDVSLVRLGFVLATVFSGVGLILYLMAWLIVPRAEYWPPTPYEAGKSRGSLLEGRQLAYGLLTIGIILVVFSGAGGFARMLVSIGLVGAGIYLLVQPQSSADGSAPVSPVPAGSGPPPPQPVADAPAADDATAAVPSSWQPAPGQVGPDTTGDDLASPLPGRDGAASTTTASTTYAPAQPAPVQTVYVPSPVPPRRRRIWPFLLIFGLLLIPVIAVVGGIAFLAASDEGFTEADVIVTPATVDDIPGRINEGAGSITLDLTDLEAEDFSEASIVQEVDIDLNAGEVIVELPRDFPVSVDASATAGEITVLDRYEEGLRPRITTDDDDAVLSLDIRVGLGSISVDD